MNRCSSPFASVGVHAARALLVAAFAFSAVSACGGSKPTPPKDGENAATDDSDGGAAASTDGTESPAPKGSADPVTGEKPADTKPCEGFEIDLNKVLAQAACEAPYKDTDKAKDPKGLEVKVVPSSTRVQAGSKIDITIYFANKTKSTFPLNFTVDPEPRFDVEVYDKKTNKRVDAPVGMEPQLPSSVSGAPAPEKHTARATLVTNGTARVVIPWQAVKYKWAPADKAKGAAPGRGYPKVAAGNLPKGKYMLKVMMPLVGVFEGLNREVSSQQVEIEIIP